MTKILATTLAAALLMAPAAHAGGAMHTDAIDGVCAEHSHTAEGPVGGDLTVRRSRFYCSIAVITLFEGKHIMVQFSEKKPPHNRLLGFSGYMDDEGEILAVNHLFLEAGQPPVEVTDSYCKFFLKGKGMTEIACMAKADKNGRRTTSVVNFKAGRAK